jgi:predicted kinase
MKKLLMLKGLPASGKSTYAKQLVAGGNWVRVNKDDLRAMMDNGNWSKEREKRVIRTRDSIICDALQNGLNVVSDDTNFILAHEKTLRHLADINKAEFEIKLIDTPLDVCIARDVKRDNPVGAGVIRKMWNDFLKPRNPLPPQRVNGAPLAILCDLDGTLCLFEGSPYDRDFSTDRINIPVIETLQTFKQRYADNIKIIITSARKGESENVTRTWLYDNGVFYDKLIMRPMGDSRKDVIIKQEMYEREIKGKYNVLFVLDDRDQVVDFWRSQGLTVFQVNYGGF